MRFSLSHLRILALAGTIGGVVRAQSCASGDDSACAFGKSKSQMIYV